MQGHIPTPELPEVTGRFYKYPAGRTLPAGCILRKLKKKIEALRKDTKTDIENLRKDLTIEIEKIKTGIMKRIREPTGQLRY